MDSSLRVVMQIPMSEPLGLGRQLNGYKATVVGRK